MIAFQIDDAHGQPVTDLNLNARLVAKLITGSYRSGGNPAVINNPVNIFRDPEFLSLNPGVDWPGGAPGNHPLLLGDLSDTTLALTRWIEADPKARAFLKGKPDPWGMTVNANYKGVAMPFASYPLLDPLMSETFEPIQELDALARQLSIARFPGAHLLGRGRRHHRHQTPAPEPRAARGDRHHRRGRGGEVPAADGAPAEHRGQVRHADRCQPHRRDQALQGQRRRGDEDAWT